MSDSDDTDVLLLIPNDFFAVDDQESRESIEKWEPEKFDRRSSNLISFSSIKMNDSGRLGGGDGQPMRSCTDFEQYCVDNFESSLHNLPKSETNHILKEIDSYLQHQTQRETFNCAVETRCETPSDIPSLKELWQTEKVGGFAGNGGNSSSWLEERLHRQQLERNLEQTQRELIQAQQKVAVALSVDQAKDAAVNKFRATIKDLQREIRSTEELRRKLEQVEGEKESLERRCRDVEVELKGSLERSKKLKETNEILEEKVSHLTTATNDIREINKKQIEDLQVRLSNSLRAEQLINDDLVRTRNQLVIERNGHRENQEIWSRKEGNLKAEQETLRLSLKHFYQKQLNEAVEQKVKEFQRQMDDLEVNFKMDYLRRERQIAERAIGQMELIFKKNEEEVRLLTEKHREEMKFVQLQLEMAQTTISEAQIRLRGSGNVTPEVQGKVEVKEEPRQERRTPKKLNISREARGEVKTPQKANFNPEAASPELQGYIETLLKKSPKFNSTRINRVNTPLKR